MGYVEENHSEQVLPMAGGEPGVFQTVSYMRGFALAGASTPEVRAAAEEAVRPSAARDWPAEARAIEAWVRAHLRYTRDGLKVETLKTPQRALAEVRQYGRYLGDCDDASMLVAAMLLAVGHRPAFQVLGRGNVPHHVNVLDLTSKLILDPTGEPAGLFGYRRVYPVSD
jgi:hypothetical protein